MVYSGLKGFEIVIGEKPAYETSHAILLLSGKYVLQLRSNIPTISAPGQWALFGGKIMEKESPIEAARREIFEELEIKPLEFNPLWETDYYNPFDCAVVRTWFFLADVTSVWLTHKLNEGDAVKAFSYEELKDLKIPLIMRNAIERFHEKNV